MAFQIKKGLSTSLFDSNGSLLIVPEEGCWYLTTDTVEVYVCTDGSTLSPISSSGNFDPTIVVSTADELYNVQTKDESLLYVVENENATYRWMDEIQDFICIGRDYNEIQIIDGGSASHE